MDLQHPGTEAAFTQFTTMLDAGGLRPALRYLLGLTDYRFIALYRFQDGMANAAVHVDRDNPDVLQAHEVPASATYCCFVRDSRGLFSTADAMSDPRLASHVAREVVKAYSGVPVMTPEGEILGTLCHYDLVPRDPRQVDLPLMLQVSSLLAQRDLVPPYPQPQPQPMPG